MAKMAFWVLKAKKARTDLSRELAPGRIQTWRTRRPPKAWKPTDGVFLWQSSPVLELRGIGTIVNIPDRDGDEATFDVRYESQPAGGISIARLRGDPGLANASFLKSGAAGTVFPLSVDHARRLCSHLATTLMRDAVDPWFATTCAAEKPEMAISIRQPYAELILRGVKTTEFRSKPAKRRGRVFLYAAERPGPDAVWARHGLEIGTLTTGLVLGTIDIMTCVDLGNQFGYRLNSPKRIEPRKPVGHPQPTWFRPFPED